MSSDATLPKDSLQAAAILAGLENKPPDECNYPTCHEPKQATAGTGRPSAYCSNPKHTAVNAHRARQQLSAAVAAAETPPTSIQQSKRTSFPAQAVSPESLRGSVLNRILLLQTDMERYVTVLAEMSDPEISAAQIQAVLDQATSRVAEMQHSLSSEQALRLKAEKDLQVAQEQTQAEREAAEQAIQRMEEVETNAQEQIQQAEGRIREIQSERDATVERERLEAEKRITETQTQMNTALREARSEMTKAQEEMRIANAATLEARAQAATAERLISEAQSSLERERIETDRLREELKEVRTQAQADLQEERRRAEVDREREQAQTDRLRSELATTRKQVEQATTRADTLATANDQLRDQLFLQGQIKKTPDQQK